MGKGDQVGGYGEYDESCIEHQIAAGMFTPLVTAYAEEMGIELIPPQESEAAQ